jgi:hypothetical protein
MKTSGSDNEAQCTCSFVRHCAGKIVGTPLIELCELYSGRFHSMFIRNHGERMLRTSTDFADDTEMFCRLHFKYPQYKWLWKALRPQLEMYWLRSVQHFLCHL